MNILERKDKVLAEFRNLTDWEDRYKHLIDIGKKLPVMDETFKIDKFKVKGCQSQVWLSPEFISGHLYFKADSDAAIVKGIVALLIEVYSDATPDEILALDPAFLSEVGITEHLSMSRSSGLAAMMKQIKLYAMAFKAMGHQGGGAS